MADTDEDEKFLPARLVLDRYSISEMSLWRWLHDPEMQFPEPVYLGRFRYWKLSDLLTWERSRARGRTLADATKAARASA